MKKRIITKQTIKAFEIYLIESEKAKATIEKYIRDIHRFAEYAVGCIPDKALVLRYKEM